VLGAWWWPPKKKDALHFTFDQFFYRNRLQADGSVGVSFVDPLEGGRTCLLYPLRFEHILHHFEIGYELVFVPRVHFNARHWHIHCKPTYTSVADPGQRCESRLDGHTIDRIEDLTIGRAGSALLHLGIVYLEELVEPCKKFRT
jgi:hypothetical protein